jgi:mRNA interferase MazF
MSISQGEIWMVTFYPQVGSEISKLRPAVVVSHDTIGRLPLKTIVPITDWKENYAHYPWMQQVKVDKDNGLSKTSAVDCFQVKNFSNERLVEKIGSIDDTLLKSIHQTIAKTLNPNYRLDIS